MSRAHSAVDVVEAVAATSNGPFPMPETPETGALLSVAIRPALDSLPEHLRCVLVADALKSMFVMGLAAGDHLGSRNAP